ncbi:putative polyol transporter 6 [Cytospora mali]|uniref:Polyol transporter 6 n=1 Tax=Cytospora mali TaxID=578113 RepID=A0A194UNY0_CYTMA|nr:putative polyol transporter 6 [Valsa mali var. pyri (nom. inval.)]
MASTKNNIVKNSATHIEHPIQDYSSNVNTRILNPLSGLTKSELRTQVAAFCEEFGFQKEEEIFFRGSLAAQNPDCYEDIEELTPEDKTLLRKEVTHKWHLSKHLYFTIALCSLGSAIQGWDNTGANGANLSFPQEFGIENNQWLIGVINSGLGMGIKISTIPVFSAEVAPASVRGGLVTSFQLWVAFGILIGFCSNLVFYRIGPLAWRFQLAAAFVPAIPVLVFVWFCPESPRWLMKKKRYRESFASFCKLRNSKMQAARDLYYAQRQLKEEHEAFAGASLGTRVRELFTVPRIRRATAASAWIVISQQFSGINIMAFYSSTIFQNAGYSTRDCLLASLGFGAVAFVFAFPAVYTMDTFGRRYLLLLTFPNMAVCLLAAGLSFLLPETSGARVPLIALFIYLFTALFGPGIGPMPSIYFSEAFPLSHREIGAAFTICVNNAVGSALSLTFPSLLARIGPTGAFSFYAGLNILAWVVIFLIIPETKQRTLEELDHIFGVPTRRHILYQVGTWLPWFVMRYVFFQGAAKLRPLYSDGVSSGSGESIDV